MAIIHYSHVFCYIVCNIKSKISNYTSDQLMGHAFIEVPHGLIEIERDLPPETSLSDQLRSHQLQPRAEVQESSCALISPHRAWMSGISA